MSSKKDKKIVGVKFKNNPKIYDFFCTEEELTPKDKVVIKSALGCEVAEVVYVKKLSEINHEVTQTISKKVSGKECLSLELDSQTEQKYLKIFTELIKRYSLPMKPVRVEPCVDDKLIFIFASEKRIDFRDLAKDLIRKVEKQITLKQIGPRDCARELDGFGPCGQQICCRRFLGPQEGVNIDMAKSQGLSAKSLGKISGNCGRLMCCLKYETPCYQKELETMPKIGDKIKSDQGSGRVISIDPVKRTVLIDLGKDQKKEVKIS